MDEFGRTEMFYTIVKNDYLKFLEGLESLHDINVVDINGMSLLHFCGEYLRPKFAKHLIDKGIDINLKDKHGNSALWKAVFNSRGNYGLVELLVENESEPKAKNNANRSPLDLAISLGDKRLIGLLSEPEFKYFADWQEIARLFDYKIDAKDQDWTYTISEPERIEDYLNAYDNIKNIEAKYSLMEMIIQSVNDQDDDEFDKYWDRLGPILDKDFELNKPTIYYWGVWSNYDLEDCFRISGNMREYWIEKVKEEIL
ncbi:MAG: ankyrin repeat domain-containing protein [Bacteroidota bacterium]